MFSAPSVSADGGFEAPAEVAVLFDGPAVELSAPTVHWIFITPTRARTGCGIMAASYDRSTRLATTEAGDLICCSLDVHSDTVTCHACRDAISR
jgi:hypothetical protein